MKIARGLVVGLALLLAIMNSDRAGAEGAFAIGQPVDVAKDGLAVGWARNQSTPKDAEDTALKHCSSFESAPAETRKLCKVVRRFKGECMALALDPGDGTPGAGWAVHPTKSKAEEAAMEDCRTTAGSKRQGECKITLSKCDGTND